MKAKLHDQQQQSVYDGLKAHYPRRNLSQYINAPMRIYRYDQERTWETWVVISVV